ncbi:MAG: DedA family protein [Robiginitomaculum sp.]|nr:DedA family protein [Robiginitomaculum sp.]
MKQKLLDIARGKNALRGLFGVSFIESSVFPIPPDVMLIPMVLARPERAWLIAGVCTIASVLGGILGYFIGMFAWETIGQPVLELYGKQDSFDIFKEWFDKWGFWSVFGAGFTPFPYKVITMASGSVQLNFAAFIAASILSRGARFFLVAAVIRYAGDRARAQIEKHFGLITLAIFVLMILAIFSLKFIR